MELTPTIEQCLKAFPQILNKVSNVERLLLEKSSYPNFQIDQLLTIKEASEMITLSVPTIYGLVSRAEIPVCKKSKRLYFSRNDLTQWILAGRRKTVQEISQDTEAYLVKKNK